MLRLLLAFVLIATYARAQDGTEATPLAQDNATGSWGCLWVDSFPPGERLVKWCVLGEGPTEIACYVIETDRRIPAEGLEPWIVVPVGDVTDRLAPNDGICPMLPADIPPVDSIRGGNS